MKKWILFAAFFVLMLISFIFDREILKFFNALPDKLFPFMYAASHYAFFIAVVLISSYLLWDKRKIVYLWAGISFTYVASIVLKLLVQRVRPLGSGLTSTGLEAFSFPSSHATVYFFIFAFMAGYYEKYEYRLAFLLLAVLVSLSRVYLGLHYLTDVIGGGLLGAGLYLFLRKWIKG